MRLIDANALKEEAIYLSLGIDDDVEAVTVRDIDNAPTIDIIKYAHLLKETYPMKAEICCKNCGKPIMIYHNFCSNCGEKNEQHYVDGGIME